MLIRKCPIKEVTKTQPEKKNKKQEPNTLRYPEHIFTSGSAEDEDMYGFRFVWVSILGPFLGRCLGARNNKINGGNGPKHGIIVVSLLYHHVIAWE